jgi:hypothetical protein
MRESERTGSSFGLADRAQKRPALVGAGVCSRQGNGDQGLLSVAGTHCSGTSKASMQLK